ncbi:MAG TPA: hypothetical protein VFN64_12255, partial [Burkholderiaceae bacterium]|nr:hypothetical protein [Burkholderiaceae bacterium]
MTIHEDKRMHRIAIAAGLLLAGALSPAAAQVFTRTDVITYHDNQVQWVLAQPKSSTNVQMGVVEYSTDYDPATALPVATYAFGKLQQRMTYDPNNGTLATVSDARDTPTFDTTITLSNWKRGIPQAIRFGDGTLKAAVVDEYGLIRSVTNEVGAQTCYDFDPMGRLAKITYPSETTGLCDGNAATRAWTPTTQSFAQWATAAYGLPAGHWRQTVATSTGLTRTFYDAMWRPVVEERYDSSDTGNTLTQVIKRYDANGRLAFQSYPMRGMTDYATVTTGTRTIYDALDRPVRIEQDWESAGVIATTHDYVGGFRTLTTNPR